MRNKLSEDLRIVKTLNRISRELLAEKVTGKRLKQIKKVLTRINSCK